MTATRTTSPGSSSAEIVASLDATGADRTLHLEPGRTNVWLLVGINGAGKTTTAAKLATQALDDGHSVLLAAADTFRAAAADQLAVWGDRLGVDVIRGQEGGDPGAVAFDAVEAARGARHRARAGRHRGAVAHEGQPHGGAGEGARASSSAPPTSCARCSSFSTRPPVRTGSCRRDSSRDAVGVTGVVLAKLDGTAKGGVVLAIESELGVPVKLVGVGESAADLVPFDPAEFAAALVGRDGEPGDDPDLDERDLDERDEVDA